ncbi:hypothetical protein D3C84_1144860 [compost metagenome]
MTVARIANRTAAPPAIIASVEKPIGIDLRSTNARKPFAEPMLFAMNHPSKGPAIKAATPSINPSSK